jgi:(1->4)-alpha-D-glucan 1-alpha-D-glucosylmutase
VGESLADPDNRRPVSFDALGVSLRELDENDELPEVDGTALAKLWVVSRVLRARREHRALFSGYTPLQVDGPLDEGRDHLIAFDRGGAVTLATRLPAGLRSAGGWGDTILQLPVGRYRDAFTNSLHVVRPSTAEPNTVANKGVRVAEVLGRYPVALLLKEEL